jgi:fructuronate reductase
MSGPRLADLGALNGPAARPGYTPQDHAAGIVHLGIGAFHRAHQAVMTDDALAHHGGDWRIIAVSLRSQEIAEKLNAQNGLYTLIERGASGTRARVVAAIQRVIAADTKATLRALCDPAIRVVTLTVTEKGYGIDLASRLPDNKNPVIAADLVNPSAPEGVLGLLVEAIRQRRLAGAPPFTVLSCDNLPENGTILRDGVVGFAQALGAPELADWIAANIAFPSSMVDRITPAPSS